MAVEHAHVISIDWFLPLMGGVALVVWTRAFWVLRHRMVRAMGPAYTTAIAAMVYLAILSPSFASMFPESWLWNVARGALLAVLLIVGSALALEGMDDSHSGHG